MGVPHLKVNKRRLSLNSAYSFKTDAPRSSSVAVFGSTVQDIEVVLGSTINSMHRMGISIFQQSSVDDVILRGPAAMWSVSRLESISMRH